MQTVLILCDKSECRKDAVYRCTKLQQKYCDEHWSTYVENAMIHFDCSPNDHGLINEAAVRVEDEVNRLFMQIEKNRLEAYKEYIKLYGDPEQRFRHNSVEEYPITSTWEEKRIYEYNIRNPKDAQ